MEVREVGATSRTRGLGTRLQQVSAFFLSLRVVTLHGDFATHGPDPKVVPGSFSVYAS